MGALYLIRHGQASFGAEDYDVLSETGHAQARALGEALRVRVPRVDAAFMGTLARHRDTAQGCLAAMGLALEPEVLAGWDEFDHHEVIVRLEPAYADPALMMQGLMSTPDPRRAFQDFFTRAVARWTGGEHDADYKESWPQFRARCLGALDGTLARLGGSKTALVFTSGGVISAVVQELLGLPDANAFRVNWTLANCGVTKIIYGARGRYLSTLNEHAHFEGAGAALLTYR